MTPALTDHLLALEKDAYKKATRHEFLEKVGKHTIAPQHLRAWIEQDRGYTSGYTRMMGLMMSRLALFNDVRDYGDNDPNYSEQHAQRTMKLLSFAVSNVFRECQMFTDLLSRPAYRALPAAPLQPWTLRYVDFHQKVARTAGYDLGEALVLLWAMERVFLDAWRHAKAVQAEHWSPEARSTHDGNEEQASHHDTIGELIDNWTIDEFDEFVAECAALVNHLDTSDPRRLQSLEAVYRETLALEVKFWDMAFESVQDQ
ncbi:heme oxygenase-like protein [Hesseltinella vesiculosa]|uniref:Heme oxygenase-like protein n=1 Tax=Hesseltinella vesiculosa TaxID=101127 RepID=A0A1X2GJL4_9FUNG|nr:heme oxygenase-like protein [Hesseltinella vesiculosa]